jgi:diaminohydroxyphosphoribosylaminopyrimidine deaminase/5-amino-6-(5-phosphoribosylamino)uracil reductase
VNNRKLSVILPSTMTKTEQHPITAFDEQMMKRALREATKGDPSPNPHVGAVVAKHGRIVSVGYHARCGQAHAEVVAMERAGRETLGATLYVTFEPCNHYGRTGPCSKAIIEAGVERVVIGCRDPAPHVPGSVDRLRAAGIDVVLGVCESRAQRLVADFTKYILNQVPFVTLKAAITLDGRMAGRNGDSRWITGEKARRYAHRLRAQADAVLVGVGTVLADNPRLTVRDSPGRDPVRVVLDSQLRTPARAHVVVHGSKAPTLIFHGARAPKSRAQKLARPGVELIAVPSSKKGGLDLRSVLRELGRREVVRLLVEGGPRVHGALLDAGFVDRVALFIAPRLLGDPRALPLAQGQGQTRLADAWSLEFIETKRLGSDIYITGDLTRSSPQR